MMKKLLLLLVVVPLCAQGRSFKVRNATVSYSQEEPKQVLRAINDLRLDIERVTGAGKDDVGNEGGQIVVGTYGSKTIEKLIAKGLLKEQDLKDKWESYVITVTNEAKPRLVIAGSNTRGTIYGIYEVSQRIGVSPWYWWADVPVRQNPQAAVDCDYYASGEPTVRYRGIFINDEDWGLKPWAASNYERELGDIGPKTYARVCELLLRLKANMLAPAMHSCTGAFYSHPQSKVVCDSFGIIITTSHCEPLLLNNAASTEWDQLRDGDWNYKTNRETILQKWDDRLSAASKYENIYTTAMRGLHDAGLRGNLPLEERVPLIAKVIGEQRQLLEKHIGRQATEIPQIFVPYKETMDIYENGLQVPDDITIVWVDDNYGYMKRVSNPEEQQRKGRAGVYYHLSYLGAPHDYLWLNTTPPVLMYEELKKAYDNGADRYWLLNVGDIKPMELGIQTFMDMAWNIHAFDFDTANRHQADLLTRLFGNHKVQSSKFFAERSGKAERKVQSLLDTYYRLAWSRKPEFMGWEFEWDDEAHTGLKPTEYSFLNYDEAQHRLSDYQCISDEAERLSDGSAAWFEMVQFPMQAAYQMNRKFLMAQLNHELLAQGRRAEANWAARQSQIAYDSINTLNRRYNSLLDGKWRGMMALAPGWCALYQKMPDVAFSEGAGMTPVDLSPQDEPLQGCQVLNLAQFASKSDDARLIKGLGYDWQVMQLGSATYDFDAVDADSVDVFFYMVPFWPLYAGKSNCVSVTVDGSQPQTFENKFKEYDRNWKDQVMRNGAPCRLRFAVDRSKRSHTVTFHALDSGQMLQKVIIDWGGLQPSYLGPNN
ncbi:MAG: glycosyl hydrolase 115 family protein [Prevotella sp.]|nr:glycosyl hydrolase 115 family protein [Prevotella sp.]